MEELVKRLRQLAEEQMFDFERRPYLQAADAIEQLSNAGSAYGRGWTLGYDAGRDESKPRWIPVKERLPQICTNVLVAGRMKYRWEHKYLQFVDKAYFNEGEFFETSNDWYEGQDEFEITHWMPLPKPPEEADHD